MSERTSYKPGTPCWIDLGTPDQDAAGEFYGGLFGWSLEEDENAEQTGGYRAAMLRDKTIGGVMKLMEEGQPPAWSSYIASRTPMRPLPRQGGRRQRGLRADGRARLRPHGVHRRPDRRRHRHLAARPQHRRRPRQRARRAELERAQHPRPERPRPSTAPSSAGPSKTKTRGAAPTRRSSSMAKGSAASSTWPSGVPSEVPAHWLVYFAVEDTDATIERPRRAAAASWSSRSTSRSAASRSSTTPRGVLRGDRAGSEASAGQDDAVALEAPRSAAASAGSPTSPSSSHSAGSPRPALLTTLRPSIAHFIRVAEISIPSRSRTNSFGSRSSSSRVLPTSSSVSSEVAAVEIAQPLPSKATSATRPSSSSRMHHVLLVAAERVGVLELEVGLLQPPEVVRPLVVLEDLVAVELVHQRPKTWRASWRPSTRRSISSGVV